MPATDHVHDKVILITGAGSGFGRLVATQAAARGAKLVCADVNEDTARQTAGAIRDAGGQAHAVCADVTAIDELRAAVRLALEHFGRVDVMVNNAGTMPLAFFSDHERALQAWHRCIDINIKGVLNGIVAVHDAMLAQGRGHVINLSSIYGNFPVVGAGVYGATKAAVNMLSESLRMESRGRIKVTIVRPTGVPGTGLAAGVVNPQAVVGIVAQNLPEFAEARRAFTEGRLDPSLLDAQNIGYVFLDPVHIAEAILHAIDQPWGVSISDVTVRASGDHFLL